jgi:hypothetical protein
MSVRLGRSFSVVTKKTRTGRFEFTGVDFVTSCWLLITADALGKGLVHK